MDSRHETNLKWWDEVVPVHVKSPLYDVQSFLAGRDSLRPIEIELAGPVEGLDLLHLQCHFGMDTLSWARRGAKPVGVDFSGKGIEQARRLAKGTGLEERVRFVQSDVLELDRNLEGTFDRIVATYGTLIWLSNIERWAEIVRHFLEPGGRLIVVEAHPFSMLFSEHWRGDSGELKYPYFIGPEGERFENSDLPDYADRDYIPVSPSMEWNWTIPDVFNALVRAGLKVEGIREYPFTCYPQFPDMKKREDGYYARPADAIELPLLYSLTATL